ncbi:hypothetical protein K438DRAFT_2028439 [Mycena galopus ATCC 62051]|nr:hypothetical protein K438DRAFT_2028439 [Mycena galopus ATCC 62051]
MSTRDFITILGLPPALASNLYVLPPRTSLARLRGQRRRWGLPSGTPSSNDVAVPGTLTVALYTDMLDILRLLQPTWNFLALLPLYVDIEADGEVHDGGQEGRRRGDSGWIDIQPWWECPVLNALHTASAVTLALTPVHPNLRRPSRSTPRETPTRLRIPSLRHRFEMLQRYVPRSPQNDCVYLLRRYSDLRRSGRPAIAALCDSDHIMLGFGFGGHTAWAG